MSMEAAVFLGAGEWELRSMPEPRIRERDDVILEVERAGICGTDLHILADPPGHPANPGTILGHEYTGRVVECGPAAAGLSTGERVVVDPNIPCGACDACRLGRSNHCPNMTTLGIFRHGGLARFSIAPARALHRLSPAVSPERAALAEPLSCIYSAVEKAPPRAGDSVVVLGAGPIGLLFVLLYRHMGAGTIVAVEPRPLRRAVALQLGAQAAVDPSGDTAVAGVRKILPAGADIVVDAAGTLLATAVETARPGGTVVLFGMVQKSPAAVSQYDITRRELRVVASFIQTTAFPRVARLLENDAVPFEKVVSHVLPLGRIGEAFDAMRRGEALKVVLDPSI
jgi:2-desacetyl-2-hydroxyethyl bacteriochlorophyllide A dehydrogenase